MCYVYVCQWQFILFATPVHCCSFVLTFAGGYVDSSNLGTGYQYAYGGGAMKGASYAAKAAGPYGGGKSVLA